MEGKIMAYTESTQSKITESFLLLRHSISSTKQQAENLFNTYDRIQKEFTLQNKRILELGAGSRGALITLFDKPFFMSVNKSKKFRMSALIAVVFLLGIYSGIFICGEREIVTVVDTSDTQVHFRDFLRRREKPHLGGRGIGDIIYNLLINIKNYFSATM